MKQIETVENYLKLEQALVELDAKQFSISSRVELLISEVRALREQVAEQNARSRATMDGVLRVHEGSHYRDRRLSKLEKNVFGQEQA